MKLLIEESYEDMSRRAADVIAEVVVEKPNCVLGLATGSTPIGLYADLVSDCKEGKISFKDVSTYNLDEYRGLAGDHDQSYRYFMNVNLFDHVDIDKAATHVPMALARTPTLRARRTRRPSRLQAASTSSCSAWATTATSASTSRATSSPRRRTA